MIAFAPGALLDLEEIFEFNLARDPKAALAHIPGIRSAVEILEQHPEIGRPIDLRSGLRELVISRGKTGYVALYAFDPVSGLIRVLAIRHQSAAGHRGA